MTYFKINIPKVNQKIINYRINKKKCDENLQQIYDKIEYMKLKDEYRYLDLFIKKVSEDRNKIEDYQLYLDCLYNEIENFKFNIIDICKRNGYQDESLILKFDDAEILKCKDCLNSSITVLNDSYFDINAQNLESNFENINLIIELKNEIYEIKNLLNELIQNIINFSNLINNEVSNSKIRISKIKNYDLNLKPIDISWKFNEIDINQIKEGYMQALDNINK